MTLTESQHGPNEEAPRSGGGGPGPRGGGSRVRIVSCPRGQAGLQRAQRGGPGSREAFPGSRSDKQAPRKRCNLCPRGGPRKKISRVESPQKMLQEKRVRVVPSVVPLDDRFPATKSKAPSAASTAKASSVAASDAKAKARIEPRVPILRAGRPACSRFSFMAGVCRPGGSWRKARSERL